MTLQFNCQHCNELIISKFLKVGEMAECKKCGEKNTIPKSAEGISESEIKSEHTISDAFEDSDGDKIDESGNKITESGDEINSNNDIKGYLGIGTFLLLYGIFFIPEIWIDDWMIDGPFYLNKWLIETFNITASEEIWGRTITTSMDPNYGPLKGFAWFIGLIFGGALFGHLGRGWLNIYNLEYLLYDWINTFPEEFKNKEISLDEITNEDVYSLNKGEDTYWFSYPNYENELDTEIHLFYNEKDKMFYFKNDISPYWLVSPTDKISVTTHSGMVYIIELTIDKRSILLSSPSIRSIELMTELFSKNTSNSKKNSISSKKKANRKEQQKLKKTSAPKSEKVDVKAELKKYKEMLDDGLIEQEDYDAKKKELLGL